MSCPTHYSAQKPYCQTQAVYFPPDSIVRDEDYAFTGKFLSTLLLMGIPFIEGHDGYNSLLDTFLIGEVGVTYGWRGVDLAIDRINLEDGQYTPGNGRTKLHYKSIIV